MKKTIAMSSIPIFTVELPCMEPMDDDELDIGIEDIVAECIDIVADAAMSMPDIVAMSIPDIVDE